jgi:hypothetical protein
MSNLEYQSESGLGRIPCLSGVLAVLSIPATSTFKENPSGMRVSCPCFSAPPLCGDSLDPQSSRSHSDDLPRPDFGPCRQSRAVPSEPVGMSSMDFEGPVVKSTGRGRQGVQADRQSREADCARSCLPYRHRSSRVGFSPAFGSRTPSPWFLPGLMPLACGFRTSYVSSSPKRGLLASRRPDVLPVSAVASWLVDVGLFTPLATHASTKMTYQSAVSPIAPGVHNASADDQFSAISCASARNCSAADQGNNAASPAKKILQF